jgi:hypothetical protein
MKKGDEWAYNVWWRDGQVEFGLTIEDIERWCSLLWISRIERLP